MDTKETILIYCPRCKHEISDHFEECPYCQYKLHENKFQIENPEDIKSKKKIHYVIAIISIICIIFCLSTADAYSNLSEYKSINLELKNEIEDITDKNDELNELLDEANSLLQSKDNRISFLEEQVKELEKQISELKKENESLKSQILALQSTQQNEQVNSQSTSGVSRSDVDTSTIGGTVWLSESGDKYHNKPDCGRMNPNNARQSSLSDAKSMGYGACSKCF